MVVGGHIGGIFKDIGIPFYSNIKPTQLFPAYSFHMPLFLFLSGYLFKITHINNMKSLIIKRTKSLVIPYYYWNLFYGILVSIFLYFGIFNNAQTINLYNFFIEPIFGGYQYNFNGPSWFLISLFFVQVFYTFFRKILKRDDKNTNLIILVVLFFISFLVIKWSNLIEMKNNNIPLFISRTLFGITFFHFGFYFKNYIKFNFSIKSLLIIILIKIISNLVVGVNYTLSMRMIFRGYDIIPMFYSVLGILYIFNISKFIFDIIENLKLYKVKNIIDVIGNNTFSIMMHHMFINFLLNGILKFITKNYDLSEMFLDTFNLFFKPILCVYFSIYFGNIASKFIEIFRRKNTSFDS